MNYCTLLYYSWSPPTFSIDTTSITAVPAWQSLADKSTRRVTVVGKISRCSGPISQHGICVRHHIYICGVRSEVVWWLHWIPGLKVQLPDNDDCICWLCKQPGVLTETGGGGGGSITSHTDMKTWWHAGVHFRYTNTHTTSKQVCEKSEATIFRLQWSLWVCDMMNWLCRGGGVTEMDYVQVVKTPCTRCSAFMQ